MKKRIFALCSALLLSLTVFAGCGSKPTEESAASEPEATATAAPTAKAESSAAESTAEPTEALSTEPANVNLLTGLPTLTDGAIGKRPVAVMVNNVDAALPQYGISAADLIFELPVEYDLTRLMAVYGDYTQVPDVCSVRSCRYYYPILAVGFDAVYVHGELTRPCDGEQSIAWRLIISMQTITVQASILAVIRIVSMRATPGSIPVCSTVQRCRKCWKIAMFVPI